MSGVNGCEHAPDRVLVKICGLTRTQDVHAACAAGADYLGFNFYHRSPRYVTPEAARGLLAAMAPGVRAVGVFVNTAIDRAVEIADQVGLDFLQFHGDEEPAAVARVGDRAWRALRVGEDQSAIAVEPWSACWGILFDGPAPQLYGGTGEQWDYSLVADQVQRLGLRFILAGGLEPQTVRAVIEKVPGLHAVDVCSGVESEKGIKDGALMRDFCSKVRSVTK